MTVIEMVISMAIMLLVLGFATVLFKQAYTHNTLTKENMTNEQLARVAMGKINSSIAQASEDTNESDENLYGAQGQAILPVLNPTPPSATAAPSIAFFRVAALAPAASLPIGSANQPDPGYKVHIISLTGTTVNEYVMDPATYYGNLASPAPTVIATNVTDFEVQQVPANNNEYRLSITVNNVTDPTKPEAPYTLVDNVHIIK
ncbi:MAG: hypothetical protein JO219_05800 [Candidatus Eremiobacteraeota bacterium]|nr:hypothetical protein [Candidatus Eremiobacteraeota bacterium]MBV8365130.1 hypothetical protein [Candidatus Eremiobacteraeota bacterium]